MLRKGSKKISQNKKQDAFFGGGEALTENEILAKVACDSICMSSYKASREADVPKRAPRDIAQNPTIIGHEFAGELNH
jgi:threonine dehydrogenase-like Zn-dependent dehydrogenase